mgnify:FL=1
MEICSRFTGMERKDGAFLLHTDNADIKVCFVTDEIVRVRASFDHELAEESYVLMTTAWEDRMDELFKGERTRVEPFAAELTEDDSTLTFATGKVTLVVDKDPINFKLLAADGSELYSTLPGNPFVKDANNRVVAYSRMKEDDCFYGFGEKTGLLDKNKTFQRERATDAMGYDAEKMDTLYKHIPFYIRLDRDTHKAVGVFYHNFYESVFNMGCEKSNYWPRYTYFQADGGDLDCFLIGGDTIARIVDNYTLLTGRPALLPKRALGYQGSSMYYPELEKDSDDAVLGFIDTIKEEGFPIDGFHLSSGYTSQNNKRCVFTWNTERFKDPSAYFHAMNEKHAQNVPNVKPGVLLCNPRFDEFNADDVFVKDSKNPETYGVGKWWGGDGAFWDFTKPEGRAAWKKYLTESIIAVGTDSVWNDNCEYDSLMDKDCTCDFDGKGGTIGQLKPLMSTLMCKVGADAVVEHNAKARPYMVCRSGSAGIQRYAQTWCGDNYTSWKSLKYNIPIITGMGLSGQPNEGADIGGFAGPAPTEELFVRWVQNGIFQPRFSIHSTNTDNTVTEPWMYSDKKQYIKDAIDFRYKLSPTLYSLMERAHENGLPIWQPTFSGFQNDPATYDEGVDFMFGDSLLVANVVEKGQTVRPVYLPVTENENERFYDFYTREEYAPGQTIEVPVDIASIPLFVRSGAILPMSGNKLHNLMTEKTTALDILMAPDVDSEFTLYEDDGHTNDYRKGAYLKTKIAVKAGVKTVVTFTNEGSYETAVESMYLDMIHREKSPFYVQVDGKELPHFLHRRKFEEAESGWYYSQRLKSVQIKYPNPKKDHEVLVSFEQFDLIGM